MFGFRNQYALGGKRCTHALHFIDRDTGVHTRLIRNGFGSRGTCLNAGLVELVLQTLVRGVIAPTLEYAAEGNT